MYPLLSLDDLNSVQYEAVTTNANNLLVLAGAGSGKTKVLTSRLIWLIQQKNLRVNNILAVTFTNKAAKEMRKRLSAHIPVDNSAWLGTFHGLANKFLHIHWKKVPKGCLKRFLSNQNHALVVT